MLPDSSQTDNPAQTQSDSSQENGFIKAARTFASIVEAVRDDPEFVDPPPDTPRPDFLESSLEITEQECRWFLPSTSMNTWLIATSPLWIIMIAAVALIVYSLASGEFSMFTILAILGAPFLGGLLLLFLPATTIVEIDRNGFYITTRTLVKTKMETLTRTPESRVRCERRQHNHSSNGTLRPAIYLIVAIYPSSEERLSSPNEFGHELPDDEKRWICARMNRWLDGDCSPT